MLTAVSAHRRDRAGLAGLREAVGSGAEYVEIDVRRTADARLVVHHDPAVAGLPLNRLTYDRVQELSEQPVPLVTDALEIMAGRTRGHLDLKERGCEHEMTGLALEAFGPDGFVVTTGEATSIAEIKKAFPQVKTALSVGRNLWERDAVSNFAPLPFVRRAGADMVALNHRLARIGVLGQCARAGIPAMIWTVNAESLMRRFLADPRVAVLVTDHPSAALTLRDRYRPRDRPRDRD